MARRIVTGDVHGCYKTLKKLLEDKIGITKDDKLLFVGDFIDRGPSSREVLDYLIDLKWQGFNLKSVRGNHEEMMLKAFHDESFMHAWYNNGAEETLKSFQVPEELLFDFEGIRQIPDRYVQFISNMPYYIEEDGFLICHAGLNFDAPDPFDDTQSMIWIRDFDYKPELISNRKLIHGHTPMPIVSLEYSLRDKNARVINLDAGCVYKDLPGYGNLLSYDLDSGEYYYMENIDM